MINIELKDGEEIKEYSLGKGITVYISNYGRAFNIKSGKQYKLYYPNGGRQGTTPLLNIERGSRYNNNYICIRKNMSRLVYKLFVNENLNDKSHIIFKDKNPLNCRYDNLDVGLTNRPIIKQLSPSQIKLFNHPDIIKTIKKCLLKYYENENVVVNNGLYLFDDLIQESLILIYKALLDKDNMEENIDNYRRLAYKITQKYICSHYFKDEKYFEYNCNKIYSDY